MIEATSLLSDLAEMQSKHTRSQKYSFTNLFTKIQNQTLIEYNSNDPDENDEEKKEPIDIEFTEQKLILKWYWL